MQEHQKQSKVLDLATNTALTAGLALKVTKAGDTMSGTLAMGTNNITNVGTLSGATYSRTADNILSCATLPTYGKLPMFSLTNKSLDDSTVSSFDVVTGPASATVNNIPVFSSTTGKAITTSTLTIGTIGAITLANTTDFITTGTGSMITPGGIGVAKQATIGGLLRVTQTNSATTSSDGSISTLGGYPLQKILLLEIQPMQ